VECIKTKRKAICSKFLVDNLIITKDETGVIRDSNNLSLFNEFNNIIFIDLYNVENVDECRFTTLMREFIDSFKAMNEGKTNWLRRPIMQPLINFLLQNRLVATLVNRLSNGFNTDKDAGEIVSLSPTLADYLIIIVLQQVC